MPMKPLRWWILIAIALFAQPVFAQDDGGDGGFDVNSIFSNDPFNTRIVPAPKVDPFLADIRNSLLTASAPPIETKQEGALKKAYDKEWKAQAKAFEKRYGLSLESVWAEQNSGRGRRGGAGRNSAARAAELKKISDQLNNRMIAALRIDQQAALRRYQSEQLRVTRLDTMMGSMTSAGVRLTPDQKKDIEDLYTRESRLRTLIVVEAKGASHFMKVAQLEVETEQRVEKVLDESQRIAFAEAKARTSGP
jgi:hypothetical protein